MYIPIQEFLSPIHPEKQGIVQILSPQFRTCAYRKLLLKSAVVKAQINSILADYYINKIKRMQCTVNTLIDLEEGNMLSPSLSLKKAYKQVIHHLVESERYHEAEALLCDFEYITKKAGLVSPRTI